jgi:hypothetical protein
VRDQARHGHLNLGDPAPDFTVRTLEARTPVQLVLLWNRAAGSARARVSLAPAARLFGQRLPAVDSSDGGACGLDAGSFTGKMMVT